MSYSIDFHFGDVVISPNDALRHVDSVLREAGYTFHTLCYELDVDEGGVDFKFPGVHTASVTAGAGIAQAWLGRSHSYSSPEQIQLMVYAWRTDRIGLVVSMDFKNWKAQDGSAIDKFVTVLCSISAHVESSFGLARVNSDYFPLTLGDLHDAVALLHRGSPEPPLLWVHERQIGFLELKTIVAGGRKILQREAYSVVYPTLDT